MPELSTIYDYMRRHAALLGERILQEYPALHQFDDVVSPRVEGLLRTAFPCTDDRHYGSGQTLAAGADIHGGRGMRYRQDTDLARSHSCPQPEEVRLPP